MIMPVKMEWSEHTTTLVSAMGMDWDVSTDISLLDLPPLEFTTENVLGSSYNEVNLFEPPHSPQLSKIISHDCMWSGTCGDKSHPGKTHPLNTPCSTATSISSSNVNSCKINSNVSNNKVMVNSNSNQGQGVVGTAVNKTQTVLCKQDQMKIPAGRSLLRNFNNNNNNISNNNNSSKQQMMRLNEVKSSGNGTQTRPDTPLSLDDDSPEFKHHIDLAGTIAGTINNHFSNGRKISVCDNTIDDPTNYIKALKEHLEDEDVQGQKAGQFLELLSAFGDNVHNNGQTENVLDYLKYLSDYEEMDDGEDDSAVDMDSDSDEYSSGSSGYGGQSSCGNGSLLKNNNNAQQLSHVPQYNTSTASSTNDYHTNTNINNNSSNTHHQETHFGDHSYTRPKDRFDTRDLGVQTPSDSEEEEIDVVSVGERTLPTNPSARDRRHLQTAFTHKISASRMNGKSQQQKNIRRRCSNDIFDGMMSPNSSTNTPVKHFGNNHYNNNPNYTAIPTVPTSAGTAASKKRANGSAMSSSNKKHRSNNLNGSNNKKQKTPNKRNFSDSDELETLEKRNLHNDMERQRRIGLKNLFEELKSTIPSIKDKERAPKVNILREAAALCNKLTREDHQYQALKKQNQKLMAKMKSLRSAIANKR